MNNSKIVFFAIFFLQLFSIKSQTELALSCSQNTLATEVKLDVLNNIYLIGAKGMTKQSLCEKHTASFSFIFNGDDIKVDIKSPFKILVYYSSINSIDYLNNQLSISGNSIKLDNYSNSIISLVCSSYDNGLWSYNTTDNTLIRFNSDMKKTHQSAPISEIYNNGLYPTQLFETNEKIYLGIIDYGVLIFDKYGSYLKRIPIIYKSKFEVFDNKFYYIVGNKLMAYDTKTFAEAMIISEADEIISFDINSKYIAIITKNGVLKIFEIPTK